MSNLSKLPCNEQIFVCNSEIFPRLFAFMLVLRLKLMCCVKVDWISNVANQILIYMITISVKVKFLQI